jgi:hypothetical protein
MLTCPSSSSPIVVNHLHLITASPFGVYFFRADVVHPANNERTAVRCVSSFRIRTDEVREQIAARFFAFPRILGISNAIAITKIQILHMIDLISSNKIG